MGFKTLKEHYNIVHTVQIVENGNICIGSPYIPDIIVINPEGKILKHYKGGRSNEHLIRYEEELSRDEETGVLKQIINKEDVFINKLPVFSTGKGRVIKHYCEEYGYPNTTHTGELMYENTFFKTYDEARKYLLNDTKLGIKYSFRSFKERISECKERMCNQCKYLFRETKEYIIARIIKKPIEPCH